MTREEPKPWKCEGGHVMGIVRRNGSNVRQLLLYREAVDMEAEVISDVDVIAVVEGYVAEVKCSVCGKVRTWLPGQESLERLIRQVRDMRR